MVWEEDSHRHTILLPNKIISSPHLISRSYPPLTLPHYSPYHTYTPTMHPHTCMHSHPSPLTLHHPHPPYLGGNQWSCVSVSTHSRLVLDLVVMDTRTMLRPKATNLL